MIVRKFRWFGAVAVLLAVLFIAACGADPTPTPQPTPTPEPTATPVPPTPTPTPEPAMMMDDLEITPATTGQDLVSRISEAETACLSGAMGDANFQLFQGTPLLFIAANEGAYTLFATCLENDNLVSLGINLMSANLGGWSDDSLACINDISGFHPEMIYLAMEVTDQVSTDAHAGEVHAILLDMYECLDVMERAAFLVAVMSGSIEETPFSGQDMLNILSDGEVECLQANLPEQLFAMIAAAPSVAGGELSDAPPQLLECISPESLAFIPTEIMARGMGAASDESRACVVAFAAEHGHYIELVRRVANNAESLSPEEFTEIAEDGFKLFSCLTDEELAMFQETYASLLVP